MKDCLPIWNLSSAVVLNFNGYRSHHLWGTKVSKEYSTTKTIWQCWSFYWMTEVRVHCTSSVTSRKKALRDNMDQEAMHYYQFTLAFTLFLQFFIRFSILWILFSSLWCPYGPGAISTCLGCLMVIPALSVRGHRSGPEMEKVILMADGYPSLAKTAEIPKCTSLPLAV